MIKKIYNINRFGTNFERISKEVQSKRTYTVIDSLVKANIAAIVKTYAKVNKSHFYEYRNSLYKSVKRGIIGKYEIPHRLYAFCKGNLLKINYDMSEIKIFKDKKEQMRMLYNLKYEYLSNYGYKIAG